MMMNLLMMKLRYSFVAWSNVPFQNRRRLRKIIEHENAPRNFSHPQNEKESFLSFATQEIRRKFPREKFDAIVHHSFIAPFFSWGIVSLHRYSSSCRARHWQFYFSKDLWHPTEGRRFYKAAMSLNRFKFLRSLRFDNHTTRADRFEDHTVAISHIWNEWNANLRRH